MLKNNGYFDKEYKWNTNMAYFVDPALTFRDTELYFREIYIDSDTKIKNIKNYYASL